MSRELERQLKSLRRAPVNPREAWVQRTRQQLVSQVRNTLPREQLTLSARIQNTLRTLVTPQLLFRPVAFVTAFAMVLSGWVATSRASSQSLPGDTLYAVKIASEKTQLAWVAMLNDQAQSAQLHLELANRRAAEVKKIVTTPDKRSRAPEAVNNVKQELTAATEKLASISAGSAAQLSPQMVDALKKQADDVRLSLQEVKINLQTATTTADQLLSQQVTEAKNLAKDAGVATVQVAVADHLKEHSAISKDYANSLLGSTLQTVVVEAGESKGSIADVKTLVAEVALASSTTIILPTSSAPVAVATDTLATSSLTLPTSTTSTIAQIKETLSNVASEATKGVIQTQIAADELSKKASEAKEFLSSGDLAQAASKIKEASDASKEVEKISDATIVKLQTTLPEVRLSEEKVLSPTTTISSTIFLKEKIDSLLRSSTAPMTLIPVVSSTATGTAEAVAVSSSSVSTSKK